jgi:hypothetical protein
MEMSREKWAFLFLLVLPIAASVYYAVQMPVSYDEAWTFINFTQKGFIASAGHYPAPNNHVLHSLITNITRDLPFFSNLVKLRISALVVYVLTLWAVYRLVAAHFDKRLALVTMAVGSLLFLNLYYSYMSRGYGIVNLFFILALTETFNIIKKENNRRNWFWFALFSTLGFYTMPSFLYPFVTLNVMILYFRRKNLWPQIIANASTLLIVFALYLPIILNDGIGAITNNTYVKPIGFVATVKQLPYFYVFALVEITGIHWIFIVAAVAVSVGLILKSKDRIVIVFAAIMISAPLVLLGIHRVIPFARVFCYYNVVIVLIVALPYRAFFYRMRFSCLLCGLLLMQIVLIWNFNRKIYAYENKDLAANITASQIIPKIIGENQYLFDFALLKTNLEFELISKREKYHIESVHIPQMSADTIHGYDYIIINKDFDRSTIVPVFKTPYYNIYQKNQDRR